MGVIDAITNGLRAFAEFFGYQRKKLELDNAPEMQARARAQQDQEIKDKAAADVAQGNLEQIRKDVAE